MKFLIILMCSVTVTNSQNGNDMMDKIIVAMKKNDFIKSQIDPANIGDYETESFKAKNIVVDGLMSIERKGDCTYNIDDDFENVDIYSKLMATNLKIFLDYEIEFLLITFSGIINFSVEQIEAELSLQVVVDPMEAKLKFFNLTNIEGLKVIKLTGFKPINWLMKFVIENMAKKLIPNIKCEVNEKVTIIINDNMLLLTDIIEDNVL